MIYHLRQALLAMRGNFTATLATLVTMTLTLLMLAPIADRIAISTIFSVSGTLAVLGSVVWAAILKREPLPAPAPAKPAAA